MKLEGWQKEKVLPPIRISEQHMKLISTILILTAAIPALAQEKSTKRGIGWDEKTQPITNAPVEKMLPGVTWMYNWGPAPKGNASNVGTADGMDFAPMCWNGNFEENTVRTYLQNRKNTKYLLGFNEPNFSAQSNMTPADAAAQWPKVEKIAEDFGLKLVAPALNFTGEQVGGRTWNPYEWLDEFIKQYKAKFGKLPKMDCLALHCYMNWYGSSTWFTTEYFYKDLYEVNKDNNVVGKYPNIVEQLDAYKAANGHFPRMMLTEFCSWEGDKDGFVTTKESQIDQMTQKIQKMELSDVVEGYAWFMGNAGGGYNEKPYMSVFQTNSAGSDLSDLGKVYVYMSSFDTSKYYAPGEQIQAKDYIDASTDNQQAKVRPNTESGSSLPLQMEMVRGAWTKYQVNVPADGDYKFTIHMKSTSDAPAWIYLDGKAISKTSVATTAGAWADRDITVALKSGNHDIMLYNAGNDPFSVNAISFTAETSGIAATAANVNEGDIEVLDLKGMMVGKGKSLHEMNLDKGIYILVQPTGENKKILIK